MTNDEKLKQLAEERFKAEDSNFQKSLIEYMNGTIDKSKPVLVGKTPLSLTLVGAKKGLDLVITIRSIRKCMSNENEFNHGHNLDFNTMAQLPNHLRNPIMLIKGSEESSENSVVAVSELLDYKNRSIIIAVDINTVKGRTQVNNILTAYGRNRFRNYLENNIARNGIIAVNKEKADNMFQSLGLQSPQEDTLISYDDSITYTLENVNYPSKNILEMEGKRRNMSNDNITNNAEELREKEKVFMAMDLANFVVKRSLSSDEWESLAYYLFEKNYIDKYPAKGSFGYGLTGKNLNKLVHRMRDGEDISADLSKALLGAKSNEEYREYETYDPYFTEFADDGSMVMPEIYVRFDENSMNLSYGNVSRTIDYPEIGQKYFTLIENEFKEILRDRASEDIVNNIDGFRYLNLDPVLKCFDKLFDKMTEKGSQGLREDDGETKMELYMILRDKENSNKVLSYFYDNLKDYEPKSTHYRRDNMENKTEVIDNFKPNEVIEPKREYIGTMNYRNIKDPVTYKTENELGLAIAEKLRQSNIRFSGVVNEDKSISFSFDRKYIRNFYAIRNSIAPPENNKTQRQRAKTVQAAEVRKSHEQTADSKQPGLKDVLFRRTNELFEKTVSAERSNVSEAEKTAQKNAFSALYGVIEEAGLENEYQAWKNENTQETVKATERKSVQKAAESAYFGNTLQKFVPNKQFLKGVEKTVGVAVAAQLKEAKIKFAGHHNKDGSVTITYDGSKTEAVNRIVEAAQTSVSYSMENRSQEGEIVTQQPVAEAVSEPQVPDVSYTEPVVQNESVRNTEQTSGKSSYNKSLGAARAARAAEEKRKTEAAEGQKTQPTRNNKNVGR